MTCVFYNSPQLTTAAAASNSNNLEAFFGAEGMDKERYWVIIVGSCAIERKVLHNGREEIGETWLVELCGPD